MIYCEERPYQNPDDPSVHPVFRGRTHVHLFADSKKELLAHAKTQGILLGWLQNGDGYFPHFDLTGRMMVQAQKDERVRKLTRAEFVEKLREARKAFVASHSK